jgi:hypothetical protein
MIHHIKSINKEKYEFHSVQSTPTSEHMLEEDLQKIEEQNSEIVLYEVIFSSGGCTAIWAAVTPIEEDKELILPDMRNASDEVKKTLIEGAIQTAADLLVKVFVSLDLKTHMEGKLVDPETGELYELTFTKK